ncbi:MAG: pentapeptide repeat-containing protein [Leptolyngbyaceae cyanobacterium RM1_405_57]|nr:pentapeptide repeat-containing protein [Leptolyngbyaceae cyanobacterium RM1_405_57]
MLKYTLLLGGTGVDIVDFKQQYLQGRRDFRDIELAGVNLNWTNLIGIDLSGANLQNAKFSAATLRQAELVRANLQGANLRAADLRNANLTGAINSATGTRRPNRHHPGRG